MCNEVLERAHAAGRIDGNHDRGTGDVGDVREVAARVVAQLGIADRQEYQLSDVGEHEVVTVGWGSRDRLHRDRAARTGTGLDEKLLLEGSCQIVGDETGEDIGGAAGCKCIDHTGRDGHSSAAAAAENATAAVARAAQSPFMASSPKLRSRPESSRAPAGSECV